MKKNTIGIIGGGNMGEALIKGLLKQKLFKPSGIFVCEADAGRAQSLKEKYRISIKDLNAVVVASSTVVLAVKPQDMEIVLGEMTGMDGKLFISIAAGLTTAYFEKCLGSQAKVVRAMPNMPALINEGITGVCAGRYAAAADLNMVQKILSTIGQTVIVKEAMMDGVTAVSGSGPAYVFLFVEQWINAAMKLGFESSQARQLVYKTLLGSAHLLEQSPLNAAELRAKVTSKGGTTQAAMDVFSGGKFAQLMKDALLSAQKRAKELAK